MKHITFYIPVDYMPHEYSSSRTKRIIRGILSVVAVLVVGLLYAIVRYSLPLS